MSGALPVGKKPRDLELRKFDDIWFTPAKAQELERRGIPYPNEFFWPIDTNASGLVCIGSMGGRVTVGWDEPVIRNHNPKAMGEILHPHVEVEGIKTHGDHDETSIIWTVGVGISLEVRSIDEKVDISRSIMEQEGLNVLAPEICSTFLKIVGRNPGAAQAGCKLLRDAGLKNVTSPADVERILGISAEAPFDELRRYRGELWDRMNGRG
jgi:hypothetical protein